MAEATLKDLKINELAKMVDTATITASNITSIVIGNTAVDGAASAATGTMKLTSTRSNRYHKIWTINFRQRN